MTRFSLLTLFPDPIQAYCESSILGKALEKGLFELRIEPIRDHAINEYGKVDDTLYGGGRGMLLMAEVLSKALKAVQTSFRKDHPDCLREGIFYCSPKGPRFHQQTAIQWANLDHLVLICGHYEGIDQRFLDHHAIQEISIGDFVCTGGEGPALLMLDAVSRLIPGVLPSSEAYQDESFHSGLLEGPHYTRPEVWENHPVPSVLTSGHQARIQAYRHEQALLATAKCRADLFRDYPMQTEDWAALLRAARASLDSDSQNR